MAKTKTAKIPDSFPATVRVKYGVGKKAVVCEVPVKVVFANVYEYAGETDIDNSCIAAIDRIGAATLAVVNKRELVAAFKRWKKAQQG